MTLHIFIGYDPREAVAYHVCANSIIRHSSEPVAIHPLALKNLADYDERHNEENGLTGYGPSNQFVFTRFLVPYLMGYKGFALFMDGDMIVRDDIAKLFREADYYKAVQLVKHEYKTKARVKYLGQQNEDYPRKNWSSVMLFNCEHFANRKLDPVTVSSATGEYLHRFDWVDDALIGELPGEWNHLADEFGQRKDAKLLHYTLGTPCFHEYATSPMADEWHRERMLTNYSLQSTEGKDG